MACTQGSLGSTEPLGWHSERLLVREYTSAGDATPSDSDVGQAVSNSGSYRDEFLVSLSFATQNCSLKTRFHPDACGRAAAAAGIWFPTIEDMSIQRMDHVGIVVDDLAAATEFFIELGLVLQGEGTVEGRWVDRIVGLKGVRADIAMMQTPDGNARLELTKFQSPSIQADNRQAPANTPGIRHIAFAVKDIESVRWPSARPRN